MNINLKGELYEFIVANGQPKGDIHIIEYSEGYTFVAKHKTRETFMTIKNNENPPYIYNQDLYFYIIRNCTYFDSHGIWELFLNAHYKGEQIYFSACDGVVTIWSI